MSNVACALSSFRIYVIYVAMSCPGMTRFFNRRVRPPHRGLSVYANQLIARTVCRAT